MTPEEIRRVRDELLVIGCHQNGEARRTCGIGADAAHIIDHLQSLIAKVSETRVYAEKNVAFRERLGWYRDPVVERLLSGEEQAENKASEC